MWALAGRQISRHSDMYIYNHIIHISGFYPIYTKVEKTTYCFTIRFQYGVIMYSVLYAPVKTE